MTKELVKKAKNGDVYAFEQVILSYKDDLYRIAKTRLPNEHDIEDAVQETIISAYQSIHKLLNVSKFKSWIIKILINNCNHIYNKNKKDNVVSYDSINAERFISLDFETDSNLEFNNLMNLLDKDERTILVLYYSEKYTTKEISKILNIKDNTIRSKILRAKKEIEKNLKEVYENE